MSDLIYDDEHIQVIRAIGETDYSVVMFNTKDQRANGRDFWGRVLNQKYAVDAFGVVSKAPNWYPPTSLGHAARAIRLAQTKPLLGYGHSMGGYACIKYSGALGLVGFVASAPQISINPDESFGDMRYAEHFNPDLHADMAIQAADVSCRGVVVFDPLSAVDRSHAEAILGLSDRAEAIELPYMLHRTVMALRPSDVLLPMFQALVAGESVRPLHGAARSARKRTPQFSIYLSRALLQKRKPRHAIALLEAQTLPANSGHVAEHGLFLSRAYAATGRLDLAVPALARSIAKQPTNVVFLAEMGRLIDRLTKKAHSSTGARES